MLEIHMLFAKADGSGWTGYFYAYAPESWTTEAIYADASNQLESEGCDRVLVSDPSDNTDIMDVYA